MATIDFLSTKAFKHHQRQVRSLDKTFNFVGFADTSSSTPGSPSEGDAYYIVESGTIFGISSCNKGNYMVYDSGAWTEKKPEADTENEFEKYINEGLLKRGINNFDPVKTVPGYLASDGTINYTTNDIHSVYMPVSEGDTVWENYDGNIAFYDANYKFISFVSRTAGESVTAPTNAAWFKIRINQSRIKNTVVLVNDTVNPGYTPGAHYFNENKLQAKQKKEAILNTRQELFEILNGRLIYGTPGNQNSCFQFNTTDLRKGCTIEFGLKPKVDLHTSASEQVLFALSTGKKIADVYTNLYSEDNIVMDVWIDSDTGEEYAHDGWSTGFIGISADTYYNSNWDGMFFWYDSSKNYISYTQRATGERAKSPSNAAYIRSHAGSNWSTSNRELYKDETSMKAALSLFREAPTKKFAMPDYNTNIKASFNSTGNEIYAIPTARWINQNFNGNDAFSIRHKNPSSSVEGWYIEINDTGVFIKDSTDTTQFSWDFATYSLLDDLIDQMINDLGTTDWEILRYDSAGYNSTDLARVKIELCKQRQEYDYTNETLVDGSYIYDSFESFLPTNSVDQNINITIRIKQDIVNSRFYFHAFVNGYPIVRESYTSYDSRGDDAHDFELPFWIGGNPEDNTMSVDGVITNVAIYNYMKEIPHYFIGNGHGVVDVKENDSSLGTYDVSTGRLQRLWRKLYNEGYKQITHAERIGHLEQPFGDDMPIKWTTIEFDDWQPEIFNDKRIRDLFKKYGVKGILPVTINSLSPYDSSKDKIIKRMQSIGWDIYVHALKNVDYSSMSYNQIMNEISNIEGVLADYDLDSTFFLFPMGKSMPAVRKLLAAHGYNIALRGKTAQGYYGIEKTLINRMVVQDEYTTFSNLASKIEEGDFPVVTSTNHFVNE